MSQKINQRLVIVIILLLAFFLRLHNLAERSLWFDEAIEYWVATAPVSQIHLTVSNATHDPPLYSYILHYWQQIDINEFWLRSLSLFASVLGVAGVMRLGLSSFGYETGVIAGLLLTFSAADIRYAQETGQYALMVCLLAWYLVFLQRAWVKNSWVWWTTWGFMASIAIYTHYGSAMIIMATSCVVLATHLIQRRWTAVKRQIIVGSISVMSLLPLIFLVIPNQIDRLGATTAPINLTQFLRTSRSIMLFHIMGNQLNGWPWPQLPMMIVWVPIVVAIIFSLVRGKSILDWSVLLIVSWLVYYLISRTGIYFFSGTRHALLLMPLLMVTIASGIVFLRRLNNAAGALVLLALIFIAILAPQEGQEDIRGTTQYWLQHHQPDDVTYVYYGAVQGFRYQLELAIGSTQTVPALWYRDCFQGSTQPYCAQDNLYYGRWFRNLSPEEKRESILETVGSTPDRLWLIFSHVYLHEHEDILTSLADEYDIIMNRNTTKETAYLLVKR